MKLIDFLSAHNLGPTAFASKIGVNHAAVIRYRDGLRIPRPETMARIVEATDGLVQPNDFFPPLLTPEALSPPPSP